MANKLNDLFARLHTATSPTEIEALQDGIWQCWLSTGEQALDKEMEAGIRALNAADYTAAITSFSRIIQTAPQLAEGWNKRATAHYLRGEYRASLADIRETLQREPRHFGALWGRFHILLHLNETRRALQALKQLASICPHFPGLSAQQHSLRERLEEDSAND